VVRLLGEDRRAHITSAVLWWGATRSMNVGSRRPGGDGR
jgi:hypothetical protein